MKPHSQSRKSGADGVGLSPRPATLERGEGQGEGLLQFIPLSFSMRDRRRAYLTLKSLCILCLILPALAWSGPGYLATVGPAPLRFWSPPHPKPAPVVTNTPPPVVSTQTETPDPYDLFGAFGNPTSVPTPMPMQPAATNVEMNAASEAPQPGALQPGDVVSPQMLLKYFNKNTNGASTGIIAPLDLSVPHPAQAPSSSATYSN
jgi:hypothetical protein